MTNTLEHMGRGGVYDQLGGGFHRYAVDERWIVPHFEKMAYDNAGLLGNYLRAYQVTGAHFFREIAVGIISFVEGCFRTRRADSTPARTPTTAWKMTVITLLGRWRRREAVLDPLEAHVASLYYHIEPQGEMHHNPAKNVLFIDQPFEAIAARVD